MATSYTYEQGYEDNRFAFVVSEKFHCPICLLVLKDPVLCKNQHYYCSSCIKKYLENSASCPTCREHLSVDTLSNAPRIVLEYLDELNIHCEFYPRGCHESVQVSNLKRHVASCGFSPVKCTNDGCDVVVTLREKRHHEAEACDFRRSKCHDCDQLKNEVRDMKVQMLSSQDQMKNEMKCEIKNEMKYLKGEMKSEIKNEMKELKNEMKDEMKEMLDQVLARQDRMQNIITSEVKEVVKDEIKGEVNQMKDELKGEVKENKNEMKNEMKEIVMNAVRDAMEGNKYLKVETKDSKQSSQATCSSDARANIMVAGGEHSEGYMYVKTKTTECFNWAHQTWTPVNSAVFEGRTGSCSFLYQGQMVVTGGIGVGDIRTSTVKCLDLADPAATWKDFGVSLPVKCSGHKVVNYNDRFYMSGGSVSSINRGQVTQSDTVYEVMLVPPYASKILTRLPQPRSGHGMALYDQKLFILGGHNGKNTTTSVVQYDLVKNECKEMTPLPYAVQDMATVLCLNNVILCGGKNTRSIALNTVAMYDVITGRSIILPCMKRKRFGCTAVLTGNVVVVMGGKDEKHLKSVECFDLERQVWQDLPDMLEPRAFATAVVKPNH